jgi:hypothetical protein
MNVVLVGTLPPRGGVAAKEFAYEATRRAALGDVVETLSGDPLSISHRSASLRGRRLGRELRRLSKEFDAVELRIEADFFAPTGRSAGSLAGALRRFRHVTLFLDSPVRAAAEAGPLSKLWPVANSVVVTSESDLGALELFPAGPELIVAATDAVLASASVAAWPGPDDSSLHERVLEVVRRRARGEEDPTARISILVSATDHVHPSFRGSSVWLVKRVIGKSRGAVTKVLRPTPRKPS